MSVRIFHLSDIHLSKSKLSDFNFVQAALLADIKQRCPTRELKPQVVVFSGDLVQAGEAADDFALARDKFVAPLLETLGLASDRFFLRQTDAEPSLPAGR
jgi:3',5'-cyclic AMP phosphodiesterase CpdA